MTEERLLESVEFFRQLEVSIEDVTTEEETKDGYKVVLATYKYLNQVFKTKKLYYRKLDFQSDVHDVEKLKSYFGEKVVWLDHTKHAWPKGKGEAEIEQLVIDDMIDGENPEFSQLLKQIANNSKTGYLQEITMEGRSQQYGFNLTNNNVNSEFN